MEAGLLSAARGRCSLLHRSNSASQCLPIPGYGMVCALLENCLRGMLKVVMQLQGVQDSLADTVLQNSRGLD